MTQDQTIAVYHTESYDQDKIPDKAPFEAVVLFINDEEYLVQSVKTGYQYWLSIDSFEEPQA